VRAARDGFVCTIGIEPTGPSPAYGYVETAEPLPSGALRVVRFVEKPDAVTAQSYVSSGRFRWNASMFVSRADVLLDHLRAQQPRLHEGLTAIADAWDGSGRAETLAEVWPTLTRIPIDHAIAEPVAAAGGVACVPGGFGWRDLGDFAELARALSDGPLSVLGDQSLVAAVNSSGLVVTSDRAVTLLGVRDVVVVDTGDALLVTTKEHAQQVRAARDAWQGRRDGLL
jgi:mannose-1-phosphate guanylyltransferase